MIEKKLKNSLWLSKMTSQKHRKDSQRKTVSPFFDLEVQHDITAANFFLRELIGTFTNCNCKCNWDLFQILK